jgi:hypothetical protein
MAHARLGLLALCFSLGAAALGCSESHGATEPDAQVVFDDAEWFHDAFVVRDAAAESDASIDGGAVPSSCSAQSAAETICPATLCDGPDSFAWDGERCIRIDCGACTGTDCGHLPTSLAACEASHASCIPEMCRATGGEWLFWAEECQHYRCGNPQPAECLVGMPVCNCGDHRSFDFARGGCFDDTSCPEVDPLPPMQLCTATGGTWTPGICCNTHCGQFCPLACASPGCVCGDLQVFDAVRGCVDSAECHVVDAGHECSDRVRCRDGLICCEHCGGAGCDPHMTCTAPVCDADPNIDTCGNNLLAP